MLSKIRKIYEKSLALQKNYLFLENMKCVLPRKGLKFVAVPILLLLGGCGHIVGPRMLRHSQNAYNTVVVQNEESQILENMVRLRYCDNITSLDIASVKQSGSLNANLSLGFDKTIVGKPDKGAYNGKIAPSIGAGCGTVSDLNFTPLTGKDYVKKYMTPIRFSFVIALINGGWDLDLVFRLCVERINDLRNAVQADGPTPKNTPEYRSFFRFSGLLSELNDAGLIDFGTRPNYNFSGLHMRILPHPQWNSKILELKKLAGIDPKVPWYKLEADFISDRDPASLVIQCRTLQGVLFYLSQNIEVPDADKEYGFVGVTKNADGTEFDWKEVCQNFTVYCSSDRPKQAYVSCYYRGNWFYIDDTDRTSKQIFMLVMQLRKLQTADYEANKPLLIVH